MRFFVPFALVAVLAVACQSPPANREQVTGKWDGKFVFTEPPKEGSSAAATKDLAETLIFPLELKEDGTYLMQYTLFPIEGNWDIVGTDVILTPTAVQGQPVDQKTVENAAEDSLTHRMVVNIRDEGQTMVLNQSFDFGKGKITFKRHDETP